MQKKNGNKSTFGTLLAVLVIGLAVVILFRQVMNKDRSKNSDSGQSEIQILMERDLDVNYPATAREVVKLYLRISECFYNETPTDGEIESLAKQARKLMDEELLESNPMDSYLSNLQEEISDYQKKQLVIDRYEIQKGSAVEYYTKKNADYASVLVNITTRDEKIRYNTKEEFILRKDSDGFYKILGWQMDKDADLDDH